MLMDIRINENAYISGVARFLNIPQRLGGSHKIIKDHS